MRHIGTIPRKNFDSATKIQGIESFVDGHELRFLNIELVHSGTQGAAIKAKDFSGTVFPADFPFGLLKHLKNVISLNRSQGFGN
jgi:hypothetical protein